VHGLAPNASYRVSVRGGHRHQLPSQHLRTDATGVARFSAPAGSGVQVGVERQGH
jgi:hypothetical protein